MVFRFVVEEAGVKPHHTSPIIYYSRTTVAETPCCESMLSTMAFAGTRCSPNNSSSISRNSKDTKISAVNMVSTKSIVRSFMWLASILTLLHERTEAGNPPYWGGRNGRNNGNPSSSSTGRNGYFSSSPSRGGKAVMRHRHNNLRRNHQVKSNEETTDQNRKVRADSTWSSMLSVDPTHFISYLCEVCHAEHGSLNFVGKQLVVEDFSIQSPSGIVDIDFTKGDDPAALHVDSIIVQWDSYLQPCVDIEVNNVTITVDFVDLTMTETNW